MRVLITNTILAGRSRTEIFVAQLADALRKRGHEVVLYSPLVGELGLSLRREGHYVFDRISNIAPAPDVIHGHHVGPTLVALAAFSRTPAIFLMHSVESELDAPLLHPQIVSYHAVSSFVREQRATAALPSSTISLIRNAVDLERFPLNLKSRERPERALAITRFDEGMESIRTTCLRLGLHFGEVGVRPGRVLTDLSTVFATADIVFATGRSALEASASGCAIVLTDGRRFGGLVRSTNIDTLLDLNLGVGATPDHLTATLVEAAIGGYDPVDALAVSRHVRQVASLEQQVEMLLGLYANAIRRGVGEGDRDRRLAALVEAYVPSHGDLPWRQLARYIAEGSLRSQLDVISEFSRFSFPTGWAPVLTANGPYRFGKGKPASQWLISGWFPPEDWGVWSGPTASLQIPLAPKIEDITMDFLVFGGDKASIETAYLCIGDPEAGRRVPLSKSGSSSDIRRLSFDVGPGDLYANHLRMTFVVPHARPPQAGPESRQLGVGLVSISAGPPMFDQQVRVKGWLRRKMNRLFAARVV